MRFTADNRYIHFGGILLIGTGLMVLAHLTGHQWAALLVVPLGTIAWLETSLRRGRGRTMAVVHHVDEHRPAIPAQGNAQLFDLDAFRAVRCARQAELADDHLAPVVAIDFRAERPMPRIRVGA